MAASLGAGVAGRSPLAIREFRRVWAGATISAAGDAASWIALVALAVGAGHITHANLPLLAALYTAPVAVGGLLSGWALDHFDRRLLLIADSLVRGIVFGTIPLAAATGHIGAVHLYAVATTYGALKMTSLAGFPAIIPSLVPAASLTGANALEGVSFGLASLIGAALAGVAVATAGPIPIVAFDTLTYWLFAAALAVTPFSARDDAPGRQAIPGASRHSSGFGPVIRAAIIHPWLRDLTVMFALFNIGEGALLVLLPQRALALGLGVGGYGWLVAATTAGELVASTVLASRSWPLPLPGSIITAQVAAAILILGLLANAMSAALAVLFIFGMCTAPMTAWAQTLRMTAVSARQRGRLFALLRTVMQATPPIGAGLAGVTLAHGLTVAVLAITGIMALPALLLALDLLRFDAR